ncbi:hypothetical protein CPB85DRAFT_1335769 [Mucidula mucida]|nr:hypothetical protein CPB85DRAFT_1335769 [Mucidula mucida]
MSQNDLESQLKKTGYAFNALVTIPVMPSISEQIVRPKCQRPKFSTLSSGEFTECPPPPSCRAKDTEKAQL